MDQQKRSGIVGKAGDMLRKALHEMLKKELEAGNLDPKSGGGVLLEMVAESAAHAIMGTVQDVAVEAVRQGISPEEVKKVLYAYAEEIKKYWDREMRRAIDALGGEEFIEAMREAGISPEDIKRLKEQMK